MIRIVRSGTDNPYFTSLAAILDSDLNSRYGNIQKQYDQYNKFDSVLPAVIAFVDDKPAGCGCFNVFDRDSVEIKRMIVIPEFRGSGVAQRILMELENWAIEKGFSTSVLETGIKQVEAIKFYSKMGYSKIDNYRQYEGNPNSVCMSKDISEKN